nr:RNA-dependent RNA polymerase [Picobirnavirus sp.]
MKCNSKVTDSLISEKWFKGVSPKAKKHLLSSLSNLRSGSPTTPGFPLYGKTDWSVVTDFLKSVESLSDVPQWLIQCELSRKEKYGPQGGHAPWDELRENAEMYYTRIRDVLDTSCEVEAYRKLSISMLSAPDALRTLKYDGKIATRAAGWRAFDLKKTDPIAQRMALQDLKSGNWKNGWAYFFSRFNKQKKRLFVPMPYSNMIGQAQYFNPFLKAIQNDLRLNGANSDFIFWSDKLGFDFCFHTVIEEKLKDVDPSHLVWVMRDFDKMDTTMGPSQKLHYFIPKLNAALHFGDHSENAKRMTEMILFSNQCPIATPDGMWTGSRGEGSGATVTNGGETCANQEYNRIFNKALSSKCKQNKIRYRCLVSVGNGDDGLGVYELYDLSQFDLFEKLIREAAQYAAEQTRFIIQAEKWDIHLGSYGKYCQYYISKTSDGALHAYYLASLILNSICNPEKQYKKSDWDKDYRDLDIIMKLSNGRELPYFTQLIDYVDNGMKYHLLGSSDEDARRILSKWDKYQSLQDGSLEYNWFDTPEKRGIMNNPVVIYLLNKRAIQI